MMDTTVRDSFVCASDRCRGDTAIRPDLVKTCLEGDSSQMALVLGESVCLGSLGWKTHDREIKFPSLFLRSVAAIFAACSSCDFPMSFCRRGHLSLTDHW